MDSKLKRIREGKGLSQRQMADVCGISPIMYQFMEQGRRNGSFRTWARIQDALGIPDGEMWGIVRELTVR